ncbi:MAG: NADH-quinone oxidoreductase subunit NuoF [Firmicutes bacterium]|nr:NADH-quinone oxidoreductase subunit NuoF [Bacillota bacterium]
MEELKILLKNIHKDESKKLETYISGGGYEALQKALSKKPDDIVETVKKSGLRGRGGAGFPAAVKWNFIPRDCSQPVYLIANADEGEPGTFKDHILMEKDPHLLIEGMLIAGYAVHSFQGFIYIRGEFAEIAQILEQAIAEARQAGYLGKNILKSGFNFDINVYRGAGSYVCGEETALIESLEGKRGQPRLKPPYPAASGLYGSPTVVNNVETLACLPFIVREGPERFASIGIPGNTGTKLFCISGEVNKPGCYEFPLGVPLLNLVYDVAGGIRGDRKLKAVIPGGLSTPVLSAREADVLMDFDSLAAAGTMLGSAGVIVLSENASIPEIALRTARFYANESCGQCTPCREGTGKLRLLLERIFLGSGEADDIRRIMKICTSLKGISLCPLGDAAFLPIFNFVEKFHGEFEALIR